MRYTQNINLPIVEDNDLYSKEINNLAFEKIDEEIQGLADIVETLDSPENSITDVKKDINDIKSDVVDIKEQLDNIENNFKNVVTLEQLGAKGDGVTDDLHAFDKAMELMLENKINKVIGNGIYAISDTFYIDNKNDITFEIDTLIPTTSFTQDKFLIEIGKTSVGNMANVNISMNLLDGKNKVSGLNLIACGSSTFNIKTAKNCKIFTQIDNPRKICSDNVFIGNNIRQCGFGFILRSENISACEGQMIKYNFIYDCYYAGILLSNGSHYTDVHSMLDFNGKSSCILELDNVDGLNRGQTLTISNENLEIVDIFNNSIYCISPTKQNMENGLTNFQEGAIVSGKKIKNLITNTTDTSAYLDIVNTNTKNGFSRNTIISTYCGGIYGCINSINTDFIVCNRTGKNENINLQGVQVVSNSSNVKFIDGRSGKNIINFDSINRKMLIDDIELTGTRQNNILPPSAIDHPLISVDTLNDGSYIINIIGQGRTDYHYYGYLIKVGNNISLSKISNNNLDLKADSTMLLKATNGGSLSITIGCFITKIGSY